MSDAIVLALFVLLPALVFSFMTARPRRYFLCAAIAALFAINLLWVPGSPDNPLLIVPLALFGIVLGGILVEVVVLVRRLLTGKSKVASHG